MNEEEKNWCYRRVEVGHSRANLGMGRANILEVDWSFWFKNMHSGPGGFKFFNFSNHTWTITYKTT
jgi:hypothetical protein